MTLIPFTVTVRKLNSLDGFNSVEVLAPDRLQAQEQAHSHYPRPDYVVASVQSHGKVAPELAIWDRM